MNFLRNVFHELIDELSDEDLESLWRVMRERYYDLYINKAIQETKRIVHPGNTLTREEAIQLLEFL